MHTKKILATLLATPALLLSACTGDDNVTSAELNDADVTFAQDMIPHHRQATEMSSLVAGRTENEDILTLADDIAAAQDPEIETMSRWLESWGEEVPEAGMSGMDMDMPGMMSDSEIQSLESASGEEFDRLFLTMMIEHHEGAIAQAATEEVEGMFAPAVELAEKIRADQTEEITLMESLLVS